MRSMQQWYFSLSTFTIALLFATTCLAQPHYSSTRSAYHHGYDNGYDDGYDEGYDDGYDDAMDDCPCPPRFLSILGGFYLGLNGGYESYSISQNVFVEDEPLATLRTSSRGWFGNIIGGYEQELPHNFYFGGELFLGTSNADGSNTVNGLIDYNGTFSPNTSFGIALRPGYQMPGGPLTYLHLGYNRTQFKMQETSTTYLHTNVNSTNWSNGLSYGLGMETPLYKQFSLRLEYDHIDYNSFTTANGTKNSPSDNQGSVGITYHFGYLGLR